MKTENYRARFLFFLWKCLAVVLLTICIILPDLIRFGRIGVWISIVSALILAKTNFFIFGQYKRRYQDDTFDNGTWLKGRNGFSYGAIAVAVINFLYFYILK